MYPTNILLATDGSKESAPALEQIEEAEGDKTTLLPDHLKPPAHWPVKPAEQAEED